MFSPLPFVPLLLYIISCLLFYVYIHNSIQNLEPTKRPSVFLNWPLLVASIKTYLSYYICVCSCVGAQGGPEEGTGSPGAGVIGSCEAPNIDAGNQAVIALFNH